MSTKKKPLEFQNENLDISEKILENSKKIHEIDLELEDSLGRQLRKRKEASLEMRNEYDLSKQAIKDIEKKIKLENTSIRFQKNEIKELEKIRASNSAKMGSITKQISKLPANSSKITKLDKQYESIQKKNDSIKETISLKTAEIFGSKQNIILGKEAIKGEMSLMQSAKARYIRSQNINSAMNVFNGAIGKSIQFSQKLVNPWMILALAIQSAVERFIELDKAAEKFRRDTGYTIDQTKSLRKNVESVNRELIQYGVNIESAYNSAKSLTDAFQTTLVATKENVKFVALLSANLGVVESDSAKVLNTFMGLGGMTSQASQDVIRIGASLSKGLGISFKDVMSDVASASSETLSLIGSSPQKLMKASLAAKALGINLNTAASNSRKLLNFDESINNELEASVLLGKNINFMEARRLAFSGDIVGSQKEALKVIEQTGDWNKLNVLQREALAKASGMEVDSINKMLAKKQVLSELEKDTSENGKKTYEAYKKSLEIVEDQSKAMFDQELVNAKNYEYQQQMQGVMSNINNLLSEMKQIFSEVLLPFIGPLISIVVPVLKIVGSLIKGFLSPLKPLFDIFTSIGDKLTEWMGTGQSLAKFFEGFGRVIFETLFTPVSLVLNLISAGMKMFKGDFSGALKDLGKAAIDAIFVIIGIFTGGLGMALKAPFVGLGKLLVGSFKGSFVAITESLKVFGPMIWSVLKGAFMGVWEWLQETFLGNSPSTLGLMIVDGLKSVAGFIFDALTSPFTMIWDFISDIFGGGGKFVDMIKSVGGFVVDLLLSPIKSTMSLIKGFTDVVGITKAEPVRSSQESSQTSSDQSISSNSAMEQKLDRLNNTMSELVSLMKAGGISVQLDGRKVSRELAAAIS